MPMPTAPVAESEFRPYGLRNQVGLRPAVTAIPPVVFDPDRQVNLHQGVPLADQRDLMIQFTVTWGTTHRDNKTDDNG